MDANTPDPVGMPNPVTLTCAGCGREFVCDRTSEAARAEVKLCSDCAFPDLRGL